MSEICLECWNKLNGTHDPAWKYVLSRDLDLCEDCGCMKRVIIRARWHQILLEIGKDIVDTYHQKNSGK